MPDLFLIALEKRRLRREAERMDLNKRLSQINAEGEQDAVAKKVYLATLQPAVGLTEAEVAAAPKPDAIEAAPKAPATALAQQAPMIKDMILSIIKDAYPMGLTAKQIKGKAYLRYKQHINPNTLTVTLGRYSKPKDGEPRFARCDGRTWFYVPPSDAAKAALFDLVNGSMHAAE